MMNSLKQYRTCALLSLLLVTYGAVGDEISVKEFVSGTIISSGDVNNNFELLAKESNENDARIQSLEDLGGTGGSANQTLVFAGYTTTIFDRENYAYVTNLYTLSLHCKQEFGDTASVLTSSAIEHFIFRGNSFTPPSEAGAYVLRTSGELAVTMDGNSARSYAVVYDKYWGDAPGRKSWGPAEISETGAIVNDSSAPKRVGCVTIQQ